MSMGNNRFDVAHLIESHTRTKSSGEIDLKHGLAVWHHESIWLPELTSSGSFVLLCAVMCCDMTLGTNKYYNISRAIWPWYIQCGWWWMEATAACRQFWVCIISTAEFQHWCVSRVCLETHLPCGPQCSILKHFWLTGGGAVFLIWASKSFLSHFCTIPLLDLPPFLQRIMCPSSTWFCKVGGWPVSVCLLQTVL